MSDLLRIQPCLVSSSVPDVLLPAILVRRPPTCRPSLMLLALLGAALWSVASASPLPTGAAMPAAASSTWRRTLRVPSNTHTLLDYDRDIVKQISLIRADARRISRTAAADKGTGGDDSVLICNVADILKVFQQKYDSVSKDGSDPTVPSPTKWDDNQLPPFTYAAQSCASCPDTARGVQTARPIYLSSYVLTGQDVAGKDGCKLYKLEEKKLTVGCQCEMDPKGDSVSTVSSIQN